MSTIKDVAKKAGVSISTASYALNDLPKVHPETKKRILEAAKSLNYYPNGVARNLKTKKTGQIGVFIYRYVSPMFSNLLEGIQEVLHEHNYNMIVSSGNSSMNLVKERQIDAAIVYDGYLSNDLLMMYASHGLPVLVLDRKLNGPNIYSCTIDNEGLVYQFMKEIIKQGYRKFAYLSGSFEQIDNQLRYEGFKQALKEYNIEQHQFYQGDFTYEGGYKIGKSIIHIKEKPKFIYCANDDSALGFIKALHESNIRVPDDIAIAGFDDSQMSDYVSPTLSTIQIDYFNWGKEVAQSLISILTQQQNITINHPKGTIIKRQSC